MCFPTTPTPPLTLMKEMWLLNDLEQVEGPHSAVFPKDLSLGGECFCYAPFAREERVGLGNIVKYLKASKYPIFHDIFLLNESHWPFSPWNF